MTNARGSLKPGSQQCGCTEYKIVDSQLGKDNKSARMSRRSLLAGMSAVGLAATVPSWVPRVTYAASEDSSKDIVVSLFLRGGADGVTLVSPYNEPNLEALRPTLSVLPPDASSRAALDLDGQFGFAPALAPLLPAFQSQDLAVVHAVGSTNGTRSHFDAMHFMEVGRPDPTLLSGWLGRHLASTPPTQPDAVLRGMGIGFGLQKSLIGAPLTLPVPNVDAFGYEGNPTSEELRETALKTMYEDAKQPLAGAADNTFRTVDLLADINVASYAGAGDVPYPETQVGLAFKSTAALIRADVGVEAIALDYGGWDTHDEQAPFDGQMFDNMTELAGAIAAFHSDLFSDPRCNVTLVVMSEFGRTARENLSGGTDHGHGNVMFVLSPAANGGQVHADWPGLDDAQLYEGQDLQVAWDYRDVLHEILTKRLASPDATAIFGDPLYAPVDRGILA